MKGESWHLVSWLTHLQPRSAKVPGFELKLCSQAQPPAETHTGSQEGVTQGVGVLSGMWETWV